MRVDRNALRELPAGLVRLRDLRTLSAAQNRISALPAGLLGHMPALQALVSSLSYIMCITNTNTFYYLALLLF